MSSRQVKARMCPKCGGSSIYLDYDLDGFIDGSHTRRLRYLDNKRAPGLIVQRLGCVSGGDGGGPVSP